MSHFDFERLLLETPPKEPTEVLREDAAKRLRVSLAVFDRMVRDGRAPPPRYVQEGHVWSIAELDASRRGHLNAQHIKGVYFIRADAFMKIGYSGHVLYRLSELQTASPHELELLRVMPGGALEERYLQNKFRHFWVRGEWFAWCDEIRDWLDGGAQRSRCQLRRL